MSLIIREPTIIDGLGRRPIEGQSIWVEGRRIKGIGRCDELPVTSSIQMIDARGKFVIPGLMNANVHLMGDVRLENLARHIDNCEELIIEAAQIALRSGITTVFDTWGPRRFLIRARDRIDSGGVPGSRIYCAGNIVGFDGPFSDDFLGGATQVASASLARRVNSIWAENVGRHLMWKTPDQVAKEVRTYLATGIDFIKFASNEHFGSSGGAFLAFSPLVQSAIVEEAHRVGTTAQAHTMSVEGLRIAVEAGCELIQHANITGPVEIPPSTMELMARRGTGAVIFPWTQRGLDWATENLTGAQRTMWVAGDVNVRNFMVSGARLLLGTDGAVFAQEMCDDPRFSKSWIAAPAEENLANLETGHFAWFRAMEEKGCSGMEMLRAATHNIAIAFGMDKDLGSIEAGKIADMLVLERNPLESAANYHSVQMIIKDGQVVDRSSLPTTRILTTPRTTPAGEGAYVTVVDGNGLRGCPMCLCSRIPMSLN